MQQLNFVGLLLLLLLLLLLEIVVESFWGLFLVVATVDLQNSVAAVLHLLRLG
jgi:hypothetical protein